MIRSDPKLLVMLALYLHSLNEKEQREFITKYPFYIEQMKTLTIEEVLQ